MEVVFMFVVAVITYMSRGSSVSIVTDEEIYLLTPCAFMACSGTALLLLY
jgi:hypothetical protein